MSELSVSPPRVLLSWCEESEQWLEPEEDVVVDVQSEWGGTVIESMAARGGTLQQPVEMRAFPRTNQGLVRECMGVRFVLSSSPCGFASSDVRFVEQDGGGRLLGLEASGIACNFTHKLD